MDPDEITKAVIGCAYRVYNRMGFGFLESVYENCLVIELRKAGIQVEAQVPLKVHYEGAIVGEFVAELVVEGCLLVELKSVRALASAREVQLVNYLTATRNDTGLLVNFGPVSVEVRRKFRQYGVAEEHAEYVISRTAVPV
jgi:GxxExxY protein